MNQTPQPHIAVIGAGISGVLTSAYLKSSGVEVTVFERSLQAGGVWVFDPRPPLEPNYPADKPSKGEEIADPCYVGLKNNVSTPLMRTKLRPWPPGTEDFVPHHVLRDYIQDLSRQTGVEDITLYGSRVTQLQKTGGSWRLRYEVLRDAGAKSGRCSKQSYEEVFDAVVVASGHYHAPRVPDIPGLKEWKQQWPDRIWHSKAYRDPESLRGKNVLLVGAGTSSADIARELGSIANRIFQSSRNGLFDFPSSMLPDNGIRIGKIQCFHLPRRDSARAERFDDQKPIPAVITLKSGQSLCEIDTVILCTGYHMSLPFLSSLHEDEVPVEKANDTLLVTDGTQIHNLHKDIFYIPDPSLAFVGVPYFTATFTLFEFQAIVLAAVFTGKASLPGEDFMRKEYRARVGKKGYGKQFHSLRGAEVEYVDDLLQWINNEAERRKLPQTDGHSPEWHEARKEQTERIQRLFQARREEDNDTSTVALGLTCICNLITEERATLSTTKRWVSYIWDTFDKSPEERRFLFKLDAALLTFASLGYFIKYLDQININNAFVSGMKEDLGLYGNELNYMQTCWTVGYVLGEIPSNIILTRVPPRYWIPAMELIWSVLTFCLSRCNTATQIYALRFLIGLAESTFYPGMQYIIGSWYRKDELAKRSCIFHTSSALGTMFSGYLMAGVYKLGGRGGFKGWQWLFIVDGIISLPISLLGFLVLPDVPEISNPWYLSEQEVAFARKRMELEGRKNRAPYTVKKIKKIFSSWHIYLLTLLYVTFNNGGAGAQPVFQQYLKASEHPKYTVKEINTYPTATSGVQVVTTLIYAWTSDSVFKGARWPPILFGGTINIIIYVSLAVWEISEGWRWACFILAGCGGGLSGLCMAWAHEICSSDNEERAIVIGSMNEMAYVLQAWLPLLVWQQVEAPRYQKGFITISVLSLILMVTAMAIRTLHQRERNADSKGVVAILSTDRSSDELDKKD
ncbi:pantothenate transporter [Aulographum hederae CBS 113979]|uniref:Pantothenate transporter n=1 Tax=Aulographum hederae CBS 113979 TaxID=1176131 RepID=A0A6G1H1E9_9PEZI|nr:pantothenate transporter [Aulographum hederae CBS 113979]